MGGLRLFRRKLIRQESFVQKANRMNSFYQNGLQYIIFILDSVGFLS